MPATGQRCRVGLNRLGIGLHCPNPAASRGRKLAEVHRAMYRVVGI